MLTRFRFLSLICAAFAAWALPSSVRASNIPVVLAINYASPNAVIYSGSVMTVYGVAVVPTQQLDISVTAAPTQLAMTLGSSYFAGLPFGTAVFISDGIRAWQVHTTAQPTVSISNGFIIGAPNPGQPMYVSDYTTLVNSNFSAYTGSLVVGGAFGSQFSVNIGAFGNLALHDDGAFAVDGDLAAGDGLWTGLYNVPDLGYTVTNGNFFGFVQSNGVANDPTAASSRSTVTFNIDGVRPQIVTHSVTFRRTNYNGLMYISSLSEGTNTPETTNDQARFNLVVNTTNVAVDIAINTPAGVVNLPTLTIPSSATSLSAWRVWNGQDPNNNYVTPGSYTASMYIHDLTNLGFVGLTQTAVINVVDLNMVINNINLSPSAINTEPSFTQAIITTVNYTTSLTEDKAGTSLRPSLQVLGWTNVPEFNTTDSVAPPNGPNLNCVDCTVWALPTLNFLLPDGTVGIPWGGYNDQPTVDQDSVWLQVFQADTRLGTGGVGSENQFLLPNDCGQISATYEDSITIGDKVNVGAGTPANDYSPNVLGLYRITAGTQANPTQMTANMGTTFSGATPPSNNYRLQILETLSGLQACWNPNAAPTTPNLNVACQPALGAVYCAMPTHFAPDSQGQCSPDAFRGKGIFAEDTSVLFSVNASAVVTGDTTPPFLVSSNPVSGSLVDPSTQAGLYEIGNPLSALVQDNETPIDFDPSHTYATLTDKNGNPVLGSSSTNGGSINNSANIYFSPQQPLRTGGTYNFNVFSCNQNGLCMEKSIPFTVQDQTAPSVSAVDLVSTTQQNNIVLSPLGQTSPYGPYDDISEVQATLYIDPTVSGNTISTGNCSISVYQVVNGQNVPMPVSNTVQILSTTGSPITNVLLTARLLTAISGAGLYQIVVQTSGTDGSGDLFSGPPSPWIAPEFITQVNPNLLQVYFSNSNNRIALQGLQPITITAQPGGVNVPASSGNLQALVPNLAAFPTPSGYLPVTASAENSHALEINALNLTYTARLRYVYNPSTPISIILHWDASDLAAYGVQGSTLIMLGYDGANWQTLAPAAQSAPNNGTDNTFTWQPAVNQTTYIAYGLFYPSNPPGSTPQPTATPIIFANTRSFDPVSGNTLNNKAKFYYANKAPVTMEARIYDTAGRLVKTLNLGSGINPAVDIFAGEYYFLWDGTNDSGTIVRNGIYLVRWQVSTVGGGTDTETKAVALIK
jgi:flagellar hook assembly protein FlgD